MFHVKQCDILALLPPCHIIPHKGKGRRGQGPRDYINILSAFDIETSRVQNDQSIMYIWQWAFFNVETGEHIITIYGRTWDEYKETCYKIQCYINGVKKSNACFMVRLVHNLSYEYQFLSGIYDYTEKDVFALDRRKVARADSYGCIEDRCTFIHSNQGLEKYADTWKAKHLKLSGVKFDYTKTRYPWTELTNDELAYCEHDVLSVCEAYINEMAYYRDTLYSIPLTATGYVRRDAKQVWGEIPYNYRHDWVVPNMEIYIELDDAFRGGNVHANRNAVAPDDMPPMIHYNAKGMDRSSSYPDIMCNRPVPLGRWTYRDGVFNESEIIKYKKYNHACLFRCRFTNIRLKNVLWGCPYLTKDKSYNLRRMTMKEISNKNNDDSFHCTIDNGRVLDADILDTCMTDIDFEIVKEEYIWDDLKIFDLKVCKYRMLPEPFIKLVQRYYIAKTSLKGVEGKELEYAESKAKINSLYGMAAQKMIRPPITFNDSDEPALDNPLFVQGVANGDEQIKSAIRNGFLPYSVGVWVTAWARYCLERAIKLVHDTPGAIFLYADTDSVKFCGDVDFTFLNNELRTASEKSGSYATDKFGNVHYMGVYELEGKYKRFATMGAKKYMYEDEKGIHLTVAGLVKKQKDADGKEIEISAREIEKMGGFSAFRGGTVFTDAGGLDAVYNDKKDNGILTVDGHSMQITRNVCLVPSTYTLGETDEYNKLLKLICAGGCRIVSTLV